MSIQKGNILLPLISAVAVLVIVAAGYFYLQSQQNKQPVSTNGLSPTPTPIPSTQDETANWKTLNSVYGYAIKYPSNWFVTQASVSRTGSVDQFESYDSSKITNPGRGGFAKGQTKIELAKDSQVYDLSGVDERLSLDGAKYLSKERLTLNGYSATKLVQEGPGGNWTTYFIEKKYPDVFFISIYGDQSAENQKTINQILSTFKFL